MFRLSIIDKLSKSNIKSLLKLLEKSEYLTEEEINNYNLIKLQNTIKHAYKNVKYYNKLFDKIKFYPDELKSPDELQRIPILTRNDVKKNFVDLQSSVHTFKNITRRTGGTTGEPLEYISNIETWSLGWALKYRDWYRGGYSIGEKMVILAGASLIPNQKLNFKRTLWNRLNGFIPLSTTSYSQNDIENYLNLIVNKNIKFIRGYPSSIFMIANYLNAQNNTINLKSVFTTAEVLQPHFRLAIERAFNCKIFDQYGCADATGHASECEMHNGFHISFEPSYVELINEKLVNGQKEAELIFTSFTNHVMPLIRYSPGDRVELFDGNCKCNRKSKIVKKIVGRTTDIIKFSNGKTLGGPAITLIMRNFSIQQYQLVQNSYNSLDINIIPLIEFSNKQNVEIMEILQYHCGNEIKIKVNIVKDIPKSNSGKFRFIINNTIK